MEIGWFYLNENVFPAFWDTQGNGMKDEWILVELLKYSFYSYVYKQDFTPLHIETQQCTKNDERGYVATNIYPEKKEEKQNIKIWHYIC